MMIIFENASLQYCLLLSFFSPEFDDIDSELPVVGPCDELSSEGLDVVAS